MAAIAAISLIVGGIGVANVMLVTVRERTREIGVRRAVGATRRDIVVQFLVDAVVISLIGGVIGLALGFAGAFAGGSALDVTPVFSWTAVILAIVVAVAVGRTRGHRSRRAGLVGRADQRAALGVTQRSRRAHESDRVHQFSGSPGETLGRSHEGAAGASPPSMWTPQAAGRDGVRGRGETP